MHELIGFGQPNDLAAVVLRAKLMRIFGIFGTTPMWEGQRLHEFYPPLTSIVVGYLTMGGSMILYFLLTFVVWSQARGAPTAILFLISYFHFSPLIYVGRFPEAVGYLFLTLAYFAPNDLMSGFLMGIGALAHPLPALAGSVVLLTRHSMVLYLVEAIVCGWWYLPFILKRKKLAYLREKRGDKFLGIYFVSYGLMLNELAFLFMPSWIGILGLLWWLSPLYIDRNYRVRFAVERIRRITGLVARKPFFVDDVILRMPILRNVTGPCVIWQRSRTRKGHLSSVTNWVWAGACYLLERGVIVYNGLPETEVSRERLGIPAGIQTIEVFEEDL